MSVKTYSLKSNGTTKLTDNFTVSEFKCNDGSDSILIDVAGVEKLQQVRDLFGKAITITSAYRTKTYNTKVGGASSSKHLTGEAFDCQFSGIDLSLYAKAAEAAGFGCTIIYYNQNFVHVDTRTSTYYAYNDTSKSVTTNLCNVSSGNSGQDVTDLQNALNKFAGKSLSVDGKFGANTLTAVKAFQTANGLSVDGICGKKTWTKLLTK